MARSPDLRRGLSQLPPPVRPRLPQRDPLVALGPEQVDHLFAVLGRFDDAPAPHAGRGHPARAAHDAVPARPGEPEVARRGPASRGHRADPRDGRPRIRAVRLDPREMVEADRRQVPEDPRTAGPALGRVQLPLRDARPSRRAAPAVPAPRAARRPARLTLMSRIPASAAAIVCTLMAACGGGDGGGMGAGSACSEAREKRLVLDTAREWYLFRELLP